MATSARSQPAPSVTAILDQLDELEALMQRMLNLPEQPHEGEPEPEEQAAGLVSAVSEDHTAGTSPAARSEHPLVERAAAPVAVEPAPSLAQESAVSREQEDSTLDRPSAAPVIVAPPAAPRSEYAAAGDGVVNPVVRPQPVSPPAPGVAGFARIQQGHTLNSGESSYTQRGSVSPPRPSERDAPTPGGLWVRPLELLDRAFCRVVAPLGEMGETLHSDAGRTVLGVLGLALLAGALAWGIWDWSAARRVREAMPHLAPAGHER